MLSSLSSEIATLSVSSGLSVLTPDAETPAGCSVAIVDDVTTIKMALAGVLDPSLEIQKLEKKVCRRLHVRLGWGDQE